MELIEPTPKNLYRNELLQKAKKLTGGSGIIEWLDLITKGNNETEPYLKSGDEILSKNLYQKLIEDRSDYEDNKKIKQNFAKVLTAYLDKEQIKYSKKADRHGTKFTIEKIENQVDKSELKKQIEQYFDGFEDMLKQIDNSEQLNNMLTEFNKEFNQNISQNTFYNLAHKIKTENV